jgi:hypothetical protein
MSTLRSARLVAAACGLAALVAAGCGSDDSSASTQPGALPQGTEQVTLHPADFTTKIDNPYWPMTPGNRWVYRETSGSGPAGRDVVRVTTQTKRVAAGITGVVVRDRLVRAGELVEDTLDWYAQDRAGNIWYLGEATKSYSHGKVRSTGGSWEAGVNGAQAGVVMPAHPRAGMTYRQEHYEGQAEDRARVLSRNKRARVPLRAFDHLLLTEETSPLEPATVERKYYARGFGPVFAKDVKGDSDREVLVSFTRGGS